MSAPLQLQDLINDRERDEAAFVLARPTVIAFLPTALIFVFIMAFSIYFQFAIRLGNRIVPTMSVATANGIILGISLFQLIATIVLMVMVLDFYFDIMVVTERRIIQIDHRSLFFRDTAELSLEDVESVSTAIPNVFASFLSFGSITVETAAEITRFNMQNLRYPSEIVYIINDLAQQAKNRVPENERIPHTRVLAVINERPVETIEDMKALGAITTEDIRHIHDPQSPAERHAETARNMEAAAAPVPEPKPEEVPTTPPNYTPPQVTTLYQAGETSVPESDRQDDAPPRL